MQLKIHNGKVDLSGNTILKEINIEINTNDKIAIVGRNGCGKTTLLRLLAGEISLSLPEGDEGFFSLSSKTSVKKLDQMTFKDENVTLLEEIRSAYSDILSLKSELDSSLEKMENNQSEENIKNYTTLLDRFTLLGGFYFEKEYEAAIKRFGFSNEDKNRKVSEFSGGQRTKIAFLKLLLSKPDLLLLDEPTNHLDIDAVTWLEDYIRDYKKAVVIVSHDRMFLDRTVNDVYEIEYGKTYRYHGNYTEFTRQKKEKNALLLKQYEAQQKEISRLTDLAERFRYKATKAAMAQSKLKQIDRMEKIDAPQSPDEKTFHTSLSPAVKSAKEVLVATSLEVGFNKSLCKIDFEIQRGERVGIIGGNGLGKSTLLKTIVGNLPKRGGDFKFGALVQIGYFDQQMAQYKGSSTVIENFQSEYPHLNDFEVRSKLGAFMFSGEDVFKTLDMLSGGEKVRLALCKLFLKQPNFLILDEPTNHMDIASKEVLEDLLEEYEGTLLFVSHDRYFVKKLSNKLIVFEDNGAEFYKYGYEQYLKEKENRTDGEQNSQKKSSEKPAKKTYTTPGKEKAKKERQRLKTEEKIALLEEKIGGLKEELTFEENISDYLKLSELQEEINQAEDELLEAMALWDSLAENQ